MPDNKAEQFTNDRERLNELMLQYSNREMKRFLTLDNQAYLDGALPRKTKELLGLTASLVLRCDDCISYHLLQCRKHGVTTDELVEALNIGLIVGGSITIPHIRRALVLWDEQLKQQQPGES